MKSLLYSFLIVITFTSCKSDYACRASETVLYNWNENNSGKDIITKTQQNFTIKESCINCSESDIDVLGDIMAEFLIELETEYEKPFLDSDMKIYSKSRENYILNCEER